jgi:subtilisin-like proprotein convertase family protein
MKARHIFFALLMAASLPSAYAQVIFSESFNTVSPLPTGWASQNLSSPLGSTGWFQGNPAAFPSNSGAPNAYISANFNNTSGAGIISNWLFTPVVTLKNGDQLTFFTRKITPTLGDYPDRLQVLISTSGASVNAGTTATSTGDFTVVQDINSTYAVGGYPVTWTQYTVTITGVSTPTSGRLAFRYFVEDGGPLGSNSDRIGIDDVVYTAFTGPCTGAPNPGNTIASQASVCPSLGFSLSLQNSPTTSGNTYQWQSGSSSTGPWSNITGATSSTLNTSQTTATWYRCNVTCSNGPATTASNPVQVAMNPPTACYCIPPSSNCSFDDVITNVTISGMSNNSTCSANGYGDFTTSVLPGTFIAGAANPMSVSVGPGGTEYVGVWVDFNRSGGFEANEFTLLGSGNGVTINNSINVPAGATLGNTRMRVRVRYDVTLGGADACTAYSFGESEDYIVNIAPCVQGSFVIQPSNTSISCSGNASFSATATGSLLTYQWQQKVSATAPWVNLTNGGMYSGVATSTLTLTNVPQTMSGFQYRVIISGGCTSPDFSSVASLTVTPLVATTNVSSATVCNGSIQMLSLTNASSPTTVSFTNNTPLPIPDGVEAGVQSSIAVSGIPAGAVISNISVTLNNLTHAYVGDLDINLIAPNGQNINLVGGLNNGSGNNSTANFVGTVISSTGTASLSGAAAPRTGVFAADRRAGYGPTGNTQTTSQWANLTTNMNGNWRLALADFFAPDAGTLNSWSISITYGTPSTGIWTSSPASPNTMFTDAAATTPYVAGSQATTVYVRPSVNTTYSVVYSTSTPCTSGPTNIPVSVSNPVTNVVSPSNATVCINSNVAFTASASGNPLTYQWQESINGGTTWTNISGATSTRLEINGTTLSQNNNRYRCIITASPCGSVATNAAILTVNPLPTISLSSPVTQLIPGRTTSITATAISGATYTWSRNGATIPGLTGATIPVNIDGVGSWRATVTINGCSNTSNELFISSEASDRLWIYPNPSTSGQIQVRLFNNSGISGEVRTVTIYNAAGQKVAEKIFTLLASGIPYQRLDFDLSAQPTGTYIIRVLDQSTGQVKSGAVLIQ